MAVIFYKSLVSHGLVYPDVKTSVYQEWDDLDYHIIGAILCQYHLALCEGPVLKLLGEKHQSVLTIEDKRLYRAVSAVYRLSNVSSVGELMAREQLNVREDLAKYVFISRWVTWIKKHCHLEVDYSAKYYMRPRESVILHRKDYIEGPHETDLSLLEFKEKWNKTEGMSILARCMNH